MTTPTTPLPNPHADLQSLDHIALVAERDRLKALGRSKAEREGPLGFFAGLSEDEVERYIMVMNALRLRGLNAKPPKAKAAAKEAPSLDALL